MQWLVQPAPRWATIIITILALAALGASDWSATASIEGAASEQKVLTQGPAKFCGEGEEQVDFYSGEFKPGDDPGCVDVDEIAKRLKKGGFVIASDLDAAGAEEVEVLKGRIRALEIALDEERGRTDEINDRLATLMLIIRQPF